MERIFALAYRADLCALNRPNIDLGTFDAMSTGTLSIRCRTHGTPTQFSRSISAAPPISTVFQT